VIITGGSGFIGRHLVKRLLSEGLSSIAIIANTANIDNIFYSEGTVPGGLPVTFYTADIRDGKAISDIFLRENAGTCVHLGAKINVADSIKNPDETMDINVRGTLNVLEACHATNVKNFVFASSAAVYGDVTNLPILENHTLSPLSPYGTSKMVAEQHISSYKNLNKIKRAVSLRIFNVYGQGGGGDVITQFASRLLSGMAPEVYGGGIQTRDFISVDDVVEAFILSIRLMEEDENNSQAGYFTSPLVFNIGTGIPTSINELATKMIKIFGIDVQPDYKEGNDKRGILRSHADINKAKKILHFNPKKGIDKGLREVIEPMLVRKK
jgi:UDP-glucose 4-epimerase